VLLTIRTLQRKVHPLHPLFPPTSRVREVRPHGSAANKRVSNAACPALSSEIVDRTNEGASMYSPRPAITTKGMPTC